MDKYHKIHTVFKRDPQTNHKTLLDGEYSLPEFEYLRYNEWMLDEKINGFNIRVKYTGNSIIIAGRTNQDQLPTKTIAALNDIFQPKLSAFQTVFSDAVCLYGECCGAKTVKGGGNYGQEQKFALYDIRIGNWWLKRDAVVGIAADLDIPIVPIIGYGTLFSMVDMAKKGFKSAWGDFQAEGIVARPVIDLQTRSGQRIITKIKCCDFRDKP